MVTIGTTIERIFTIVTTVIEEITSNVWLMIPFVAGFVFLGIRILRKLKRG
jgi:hypothetical protein